MDRLINHQSLMHGLRPPQDRHNVCPDCGKNFTGLANLNKHRRTMHGIQQSQGSQNICPECDKNFTRADNLNNHRRLKHGIVRAKEIKSRKSRAPKQPVNLRTMPASPSASPNHLVHDAATISAAV